MSKKMKRHGYKLIFWVVLTSIGFVLGNVSFAAPGLEGIQIYQKNLHFSPEHKQKLADDITRYRNADNLWDVLRDEFALPHYQGSAAVQAKIEWFMNNQDYLLRSASRAAPYLYYILQQVRKRHLPAELVLLPIVESGYNPYSLSSVGAAGIWQLMPNTASGLGIKRDFWYDGRRDVIASTRAALNYLAYLQSFFDGNWLLAIAAYNTGEGNVQSAMKRNIREGRDTDFWSLPVAQETKDYVPSLLALAIIISHPDQYPIYFPPVHNAPYLAEVDIGSQINLKYAASLAGLSYKRLMQLNPGFNRLSTSNKGPYKLILPIENVDQFSENLARTPLIRQINWIHYKMKSGDTLLSVAKKFSTSTSAIRKLNHLGKNNLRRGTNLLIPSKVVNETIDSEMTEVASNEETTNNNVMTITNQNKKSNETQTLADINSVEKSNTKYTLQPGDTIYMVRTKDSLNKIAKRFHVSSQSLLAANDISERELKPGKQLIIPTHVGAPRTDIPAPFTTTTEKKLQPGDTIYMVRRGDTIEKIANKFHTTPGSIRLVNLVDNNTLTAGDKLVIPTHLRS